MLRVVVKSRATRTILQVLPQRLRKQESWEGAEQRTMTLESALHASPLADPLANPSGPVRPSTARPVPLPGEFSRIKSSQSEPSLERKRRASIRVPRIQQIPEKPQRTIGCDTLHGFERTTTVGNKHFGQQVSLFQGVVDVVWKKTQTVEAFPCVPGGVDKPSYKEVRVWKTWWTPSWRLSRRRRLSQKTGWKTDRFECKMRALCRWTISDVLCNTTQWLLLHPT